MTPIFFGKIENGKLTLEDSSKFFLYLSKFEGKDVQILIRKDDQNRTLAENRYYWGVIVRMVADEMGIIPDEAHDFLKGLFLKVGVDVNGKRYEVTKSTASLSIGDFENYCEKCRQWFLSEFGGAIPLPNEIEIEI